MKSIIIELSLNARGKSEIYVGNCEWLQHKSKIFLKEYLKKYKRVLTDNVRVLNTLEINAHTLYRTFYFELDDKTNRKVKKHLETFSNRFDFIFGKYSLGNQNAFVLSDIEICIVELSNALFELKEFSRKYKHHSLKHQANTFLKMLYELELQFEKDKKSLDLSEQYKEPKMAVVRTLKKSS